MLVAVALLAAACGAPAPQVRTGSGLVLAVRVDGGLMPYSTPYRPPDVALYGDGRIVASARYRPESARTAWVTRAFVDRVVRRAGDLGLGEGRRVRGDQRIADGTSTSITFVHDGRRARTTVEPGADAGDLQDFAQDLDLARIARRDLRAAPGPYRTARLAVVARPAPGGPDGVRRWKLAPPARVPALGGATCGIYDAARVAHLPATSLWTIRGRPMQVAPMPLLPGERTCADLARRP